MKNVYASAVVLSFFLSAIILPGVTFAQSVQQSNQPLIQVLMTLVRVLEQEIVALEAQQGSTTPAAPLTQQNITDVTATTSMSVMQQPNVTQQPVSQPPQFIQTPSFGLIDAFGNATSSARNATEIESVWSTDIPATAVLYQSVISRQDLSDYPYNPGVQVAQTWNTPATQFAYSTPYSLEGPYWYYAVVITANGTSTVYRTCQIACGSGEGDTP